MIFGGSGFRQLTISIAGKVGVEKWPEHPGYLILILQEIKSAARKK